MNAARSADMLRAEDGAALWRAIATGRPAPVSGAAAARLAELLSLAHAAALLGPQHVGAARVRQSLLNNRLLRSAHIATLARIDAAGIPVVCLKGFALAHTLYGDPDTRVAGDLDILVPEDKVGALVACLAGAGFAFRPIARPPWGFISEASFMPFASPDGLVNLDIHVEPDCYPAFRSLTADTLRGAATRARAGALTIRVPSPTHSFLLCATNTAKDKFGPFTARKLVDACLLLRGADPLDWSAMADLARGGGFMRPLGVFLALLARLGATVDATRVAPAQRLWPPATGEFERMVADTLTLWQRHRGWLAALRREALLCTEPAILARHMRRRAWGVVRPSRGIPKGAPVA